MLEKMAQWNKYGKLISFHLFSSQDFESLAEDSGLSDEWISFEDFCQGVDSFLAPNSKSPAPPTSMNEGETIATLPTGKFFALHQIIVVTFLR